MADETPKGNGSALVPTTAPAPLAGPPGAAIEPPPCSPSGVPFQAMTAPLAKEGPSPEEALPPWAGNPHFWDSRNPVPARIENDEHIVDHVEIGPETSAAEMKRLLDESGYTSPAARGLKIG